MVTIRQPSNWVRLAVGLGPWQTPPILYLSADEIAGRRVAERVDWSQTGALIRPTEAFQALSGELIRPEDGVYRFVSWTRPEGAQDEREMLYYIERDDPKTPFGSGEQITLAYDQIRTFEVELDRPRPRRRTPVPSAPAPENPEKTPVLTPRPAEEPHDTIPDVPAPTLDLPKMSCHVGGHEKAGHSDGAFAGVDRGHSAGAAFDRVPRGRVRGHRTGREAVHHPGRRARPTLRDDGGVLDGGPRAAPVVRTSRWVHLGQADIVDEPEDTNNALDESSSRLTLAPEQSYPAGEAIDGPDPYGPSFGGPGLRSEGQRVTEAAEDDDDDPKKKKFIDTLLNPRPKRIRPKPNLPTYTATKQTWFLKVGERIQFFPVEHENCSDPSGCYMVGFLDRVEYAVPQSLVARRYIDEWVKDGTLMPSFGLGGPNNVTAAIPHPPRDPKRYFTQVVPRRLDRYERVRAEALAAIEALPRDVEADANIGSHVEYQLKQDIAKSWRSAIDAIIRFPDDGRFISNAIQSAEHMKDEYRLPRVVEAANSIDLGLLAEAIESYNEYAQRYEVPLVDPGTVAKVKAWVDGVHELESTVNSFITQTTEMRRYDRDRNPPATEAVETLYHATVNAHAIVMQGFSSEVPEKGGLGGSQSTKSMNKGISFTGDLYIAKEIARSLREAIGIANGEYTYDDVIAWAAADGLDTKKIEQSARMTFMRHRDVPPGFRQEKGYESEPHKHTPDAAWSAYRSYLGLGKRYDPLYFGVSEKAFKGLDPADVGVVAAKVDMTDPDIHWAYGMVEFRVPPRAVLSIEGLIAERPNKRARVRKAGLQWTGNAYDDHVRFILKDYHTYAELWAFDDGRWHVRLADPEKPYAGFVEDLEGEAAEANREQAFWTAAQALPAWTGVPPFADAVTPEARARRREEHLKEVRRQERERARGSNVGEEGHYPDLLLGPGEVRGTGDEDVLSDDGTIVHYASPDRSRHRFVYLVDGQAVAGLTLKAKRPRGGQQTATIDRVYTSKQYRRQGYASALIDAARAYFRKVHHSKDLTDHGRAWKKSVGALVLAMPMKAPQEGLIMEWDGVPPRVAFHLYDYAGVEPEIAQPDYPDEPVSIGMVTIGETPDPNVMMVRHSGVHVSGYGPLLYDAALEWVAREGKWLCADRRSVTTDAAAVWARYMGRSDVERRPLPPELQDAGSRHWTPEQKRAMGFMFRKPDDSTLRFFEAAYERRFGELPRHMQEREQEKVVDLGQRRRDQDYAEFERQLFDPSSPPMYLDLGDEDEDPDAPPPPVNLADVRKWRPKAVLSVEGVFHDQQFGDAAGEYDVPRLYNWAVKHVPVRQVPIDELAQNLEPSQADSGEQLPGHPDFLARSESADLSYPILLVEYPDGLWCADGVHRLWKARASGADTIAARVIPSDVLEAIGVDRSASDLVNNLPALDALEETDAAQGNPTSGQPAQWPDSYTSENQYEDPDLKLG